MRRTKVSVYVQYNGILYTKNFMINHRPERSIADIVREIVRKQWGTTELVYSWAF